MNNIRNALSRPVSVIAVIALLFALSSFGQVYAAIGGGQVQYRSLKLSDNGVSGNPTITSGVGSGTNVTYRVTFQAASNYTIKGVVLDFCRGTDPDTSDGVQVGTPFIGDSNCPDLPGFSVGNTPVVDTTAYNGASGLGSGWNTSSLNSGQTFRMTNSTGTALTNDGTTNYTFAVSGVTNTTTLGTFYARLITYTSNTGDVANYSHANPGNYQDYGGFALSTANIIQVTAKVQESLVFCVLGSTTLSVPPAAPVATSPTDCSDTTASAPAIILGHGQNNTLEANQIDKNYVYSFVSTNALHGVTVRIHNGNITCGGLQISGTPTCGIPAVNAGAATTPSSAMTAGTAAFGVSIASNPDTSALAPYDGDPANNYYGMDTTTTGENVKTDFGSRAITSSGPVNNASNLWTFAATASATTAAGIYQANIAAIATGTF